MPSSRIRDVTRAAKKAILGPGVLNIAGLSLTVAYEARGAWEEHDFLSLRALTRNRSCIFDVGAYQGITALLMCSSMHESGQVFAFEPSGSAADVILENARLNGLSAKLNVVHALVGRNSGEMVWFHDEGASVFNSVHAGRSLVSDRVRRTLRPILSLDDFASSLKVQPDFVKIDVEGAEVQVLEGMVKTLERSRPTIFLEIHELAEMSIAEHAAEVMRIVAPFEYQLFGLETRTSLSPEDLEGKVSRVHTLLLPNGTSFPPMPTSNL